MDPFVQYSNPRVAFYVAKGLWDIRPAEGVVISRKTGTAIGHVDKASGFVRFVMTHATPPFPILVHRLIWETVNGPIPVGHKVRHNDGDKTNNRIDNLGCVTASQNRILDDLFGK